MITRAQAEALLTLAESLEACERQQITFTLGDDVICLNYPETWEMLFDLTGSDIRDAVQKLIPKSET
jgi:hypothetical protein